jgi:hypothetical protein
MKYGREVACVLWCRGICISTVFLPVTIVFVHSLKVLSRYVFGMQPSCLQQLQGARVLAPDSSTILWCQCDLIQLPRVLWKIFTHNHVVVLKGMDGGHEIPWVFLSVELCPSYLITTSVFFTT